MAFPGRPLGTDASARATSGLSMLQSHRRATTWLVCSTLVLVGVCVACCRTRPGNKGRSQVGVAPSQPNKPAKQLPRIFGVFAYRARDARLIELQSCGARPIHATEQRALTCPIVSKAVGDSWSSIPSLPSRPEIIIYSVRFPEDDFYIVKARPEIVFRSIAVIPPPPDWLSSEARSRLSGNVVASALPGLLRPIDSAIGIIRFKWTPQLRSVVGEVETMIAEVDARVPTRMGPIEGVDRRMIRLEYQESASQGVYGLIKRKRNNPSAEGDVYWFVVGAVGDAQARAARKACETMDVMAHPTMASSFCARTPSITRWYRLAQLRRAAEAFLDTLNTAYNQGDATLLESIYRPGGQMPEANDLQQFVGRQRGWLTEAGKVLSSKIISLTKEDDDRVVVVVVATSYQRKKTTHETLELVKGKNGRMFLSAVR